MKISMLEGNLQILLQSKKDEKQKALSMFFDPTDCHDLYPQNVDCGPRKGKWTKEDSGSQKQPDGQFKVWAEYVRYNPDDMSDGGEIFTDIEQIHPEVTDDDQTDNDSNDS